MFTLIPLVVRNVLRNRRRTLLTLASTAISLALLALMIAIYQGFFYGTDISPSQALRLITRHRVSLTQALPASYMQRIKGIDGVKAISSWSWFQGVYKDPQDFFARFAVDADTIFDIHQDFIIPPDQLVAFKRERTACVIAEVIAKQFKIKIGDHVPIQGDIYPVDLDLICTGIFSAPPSSECLLFHREYLTELLPVNSPTRDTVGTYIMLGDSADSLPRIARAIDSMYDNSPQPTRTESEKEFGRSFLAFLGNIRVFLAAISAAVTFTILLVSANTVAMAVRERTREMAILRTIGFTPSEILQMVLGEAVLISILGGIVGLGLGAILAQGAQAIGGGFGFQGVRWQAAIIVLVMAAIIGFFAALVPATVASRKNVVESLRFTG